MTMKRLDDFRMRLGRDELVPIMVGGMGAAPRHGQSKKLRAREYPCT